MLLRHEEPMNISVLPSRMENSVHNADNDTRYRPHPFPTGVVTWA